MLPSVIVNQNEIRAYGPSIRNDVLRNNQKIIFAMFCYFFQAASSMANAKDVLSQMNCSFTDNFSEKKLLFIVSGTHFKSLMKVHLIFLHNIVA